MVNIHKFIIYVRIWYNYFLESGLYLKRIDLKLPKSIRPINKIYHFEHGVLERGL